MIIEQLTNDLIEISQRRTLGFIVANFFILSLIFLGGCLFYIGILGIKRLTTEGEEK